VDARCREPSGETRQNEAGGKHLERVARLLSNALAKLQGNPIRVGGAAANDQ
jgi:hypothetical protein